MQQLGGTVSKVDPAVLYWLDDSCNVMGVLACHVDDLIWDGSDTFSKTVVPHLKAAFQVGCEEHNSFSYIGMEVHYGGWNRGTTMYVHKESATYSCGPHQSHTTRVSLKQIVKLTCISQRLAFCG